MKKNINLISYPFLNEPFGFVDHEVATDYLSSILGRILSMGTVLYEETFWLMDKVLHLNGSLRGNLAIHNEDIEYGLNLIENLKEKNKERINGFVYPTGTPLACEYHIARGEAKKICRLLYILKNQGFIIPDILIDFTNLITNLLFLFSLEINRLSNVEEKPFISKSY